jgi:integrase/recombinase XerD
MTIAICGLKFFFEQTLQKEWVTFNIVRPAPEKKLPLILSVAEVRQILALVRLWRYKVCLTTIYSCGLRLQADAGWRHVKISSCRSKPSHQSSAPSFASSYARVSYSSKCRRQFGSKTG